MDIQKLKQMIDEAMQGRPAKVTPVYHCSSVYTELENARQWRDYYEQALTEIYYYTLNTEENEDVLE